MKAYYYLRNSVENFDITKGVEIRGIEDKVLSEEEIKEQNKTELYKDCIIFMSESPFVGYPIIDIEGDTFRSATRLELINLGI